MLSNKMTVSLMSLITIIALAFVVTPAMAQDFGASFSVTDVSFAGDDQVELAATGPVVINLKFDEVVSLADVQAVFGADAATDGDGGGVVDIFNKFGALVDTTTQTIAVAERDLDPGTETGDVRFDGKNYMITIAGVVRSDTDDNTNSTSIRVFIAEGKVGDANPDSTKKNKKAGPFTVNLVGPDVTGDDGETPPTPNTRPRPVSMMLANNLLVPDAGFTGDSFDVIITLSEQPKENKFPKGLLTLDAKQGAAADGVYLGDMARPADGVIVTGRTMMYHRFLVKITPRAFDGDLVIKLNAFEDQNKPTPNMYMPPANDITRSEGIDMLTVKIKKAGTTTKSEGIIFTLPKDKVIPASGYLVVAEEKAGSGVVVPGGDIDKTPKASDRTPAQLLYNVIDDGDLPNLETFLANGGVIDVVSPHPLVISEVMWGSDASIEDDHSKSQWIELYNAGAEYKTKDDDVLTDADEAVRLIFYGPNETPPAKTAAVAATATTAAVPAALPAGVTDRIGTIDAKGAYWSLAGKGQSGRTGTDEEAGQLAAVVPTLPIISMYRAMVPSTAPGAAVGAMMPGDGQMAASWMQSTPPNVNFDPNKAGNRVGSPGAARLITAAEIAATAAAEKAKADAAAAAAAKAADTSVMMPKVGQIYISEIMVAGGGTLPQWIEISNGSRTEMVNLSGWTITVDNAAADADVSVGASIKFTVPEGTKIHPSGQNDYPSTLLVVTEAGRNNLTGAMAAGQVLNLWTENQTELILGGVTKRRYSLLSSMAFQIMLAPPEPIAVPAKAAPAPTTAAEIAAKRAADAAKKAADAKATAERKAATDVVGNLGADGAAAWALPMSEDGGRSSLIRRHVPVSIGPAEPEMGTMMDSWVLASDTSFAQITHVRASSFYGAANDVGTPGFRAGGALPVELSHFRPARNKETGAAVITWSTQSELNNAGFFIKRSQQKDGEFTVINATMVPGAGTTSEKQFYTYTDTTAQPNVVYYYQIEDVSLDGNRQTLTRGIRLKGHVGAAGKATTTWGDLKTSNE